MVCSSAHHTAKSSACRVFDTCLGTVVVMSFIQTRKREGDTTPPCGTPSLNLTCLLIIPSTFTLAVLLKRKSLSHLYILPCTPARKSFSSSPSFQTLSKTFDRSKKTARTFFFSWKASSMPCVKRASLSSVLWNCRYPVCAEAKTEFDSRCRVSLLLMILSRRFPTQLSRLIGR